MELVNETRGIKKRAKAFKKNLENAVESGKGIAVFVLVMTAASFLLCRVPFGEGVFPCGAALITAAMDRNRLNVYLLPVMAAAMLTCHFDGYYVLGDLAATILCGIVFVLLGRHKWDMLARSAVAAAITVTANCGYYLAAGMLYRFDLSALLWEAALVMGLCYLFCFSLKVWFAGKEPVTVPMEKIVLGTIAILMLVLCSEGFASVGGVVSISLVGGLFLTLLAGSRMGALAGASAGGIAGTILAFCAGSAPGLLLNLMCGGMVAGVFKGQNRIFAVICFTGACLAPGLLPENSSLNIPTYAPVAASALLLLIPRKWLLRLDPMSEGLRNQEVQEELRVRDKLSATLTGYLRELEFLANLYGGRKDGRAVMGYQFGGLACAVRSLISDVEGVCESEEVAAGYALRGGEASYAREGKVSGDSYLCKPFGKGKYMMILSDGMGKGELAARESNLAVHTLAKLLEVGYDPEAAIRTVNSILLMQGGEIFSTIDMGILDMKTAKLRIFKVGAAATFIKRREKVAAVKMPALPAGIVDGLHIDTINVRLRRGDQLVMVSDGIIDSCREDLAGEWLMDAISRVKSSDPQTMADLIINRTVENYGLKEKDDLTVLTFRID